MARRTRSRAPTASFSWRAPASYAGLVLAGGVPIAYHTFAERTLLDVRAGPFQLFPLMLWPGLLALALGGGRRCGWGPPGPAALALSVSYPLVVAALTAVLAAVTGLGVPAQGLVAGDVAAGWARETLASFAGSLFTVLGEEVGWRGFLQRRLEPLGPLRALLGAAAVATAYHALALVAPGLREGGAPAAAGFLLGVFLLQIAAGILYRAADSLWAPFLFHLLWNATNPVLTGDPYLGAEPGVVVGKPWLIGGEGLLGALASALCLGPLHLAGRALAARVGRPRPLWAKAAFASAGLGLAVAGAIVSATGRTEPAASPDPRARARQALERGLDFLERHRETLSLDAVFLLRLVEGALPGTRAGDLAARALPAAQRDPTYGLFAELVQAPRRPHPPRPLPDAPVSGVPDPSQPFDEKFSDQCLRGALRCEWAPGCRAYKLRTGQWGYVLSHQVLFFLFAKEKKCAWDVDADAWLGRLSRAMLREQEADAAFSDLYAERMGLGAYAGFRDFLREPWIRVILDAQTPEGCWRWSASETECSDHTTGMAAWVLALYLGDRSGAP